MFKNHDGDLSRWHLADEPFSLADGSANLKRLENYIRKHALGLLVIDSQSTWPLSEKEMGSTEYGQSLNGLGKLAKDTRCTVLLIRHKPKHAKPGDNDGLGSITTKGKFRFQTASKRYGDTCVFLSGKAGPGWGSGDKPGWKYRADPEHKTNEFAKIEWLGPVDQEDEPDDAGAIQDAGEIVLDILKNAAVKAMRSKSILEAATAKGVARSTYYKALKHLAKGGALEMVGRGVYRLAG